MKLTRTVTYVALISTLFLAGWASPMAVPAVSADTAPVASGPEDIGLCTAAGPRPCVVSVLRNGAPLDEEWSFVAQYWRATSEVGNASVSVSAFRPGDGAFDLGAASLDDTWQVTLDMGEVAPRGVTGHAQDVTVDRAGHRVTVTGRPVTVSGQCDRENVCPEWSEFPDPVENAQWDGTFDVHVTDFGGWADAPSLDAVDGLELFSNVATTSVPPVIRHDEATGSDYLWIEMANRHYYEDGTTVVRGQLDLRIPNEFLRVAYGVPNPELMTSDALDPEVTGRASGSGTVSVTQDPAGDAMLVSISGVTFSRRVALIRRGVIVPTRPADVTARRLSTTRARVDFDRARPRGAKVRGHQVRCAPATGSKPAVAAQGRAPVTVTGLEPGTAYDCRVRGLSRAGAGPWSKAVSLPR